ncbi:MAG: biotin/lipoyl-containing protein [Eubacteriales bacterium]|nr:biotin/lipoyl-containing protein [Eubacteriales bacterium]
MIKKFKIYVDGIGHDVEVEEMSGISTSETNKVQSTPINQNVSVASETKEEIKKTQTNISSNSQIVNAPLQGTVLEIKVQNGQSVKAGDVLVIIEAMKMENEIVSPSDGVVSAILCSKQQKVNAGDGLIAL